MNFKGLLRPYKVSLTRIHFSRVQKNKAPALLSLSTRKLELFSSFQEIRPFFPSSNSPNPDYFNTFLKKLHNRPLGVIFNLLRVS